MTVEAAIWLIYHCLVIPAIIAYILVLIAVGFFWGSVFVVMLGVFWIAWILFRLALNIVMYLTLKKSGENRLMSG